jgi:rhamnogalacturonan acetylesterase
MKSLSIIPFFAIAATVWTPPILEERATPKIYLAGDSTIAPRGSGKGTNGTPFSSLRHCPPQLTLTQAGANGSTTPSRSPFNSAIAGRSYTVEGHFNTIAAAVTPGDFVLIEFGHNDGGNPNPTDNGRSDYPGSGSQICTTAAEIVVQTFPTYMTNAAKLMLSKGAKVIISSQTLNNPWESGAFSYAPTRFVTYAKAVVQALGNPNVVFVDHGQYVANEYQSLGKVAVDAFFPNDHTHTSPAGVTVVEKAFMKGLMCGASALSAYSKNSTASIEGNCV